jgi:hypothetical protein
LRCVCADGQLVDRRSDVERIALTRRETAERIQRMRLTGRAGCVTCCSNSFSGAT